MRARFGMYRFWADSAHEQFVPPPSAGDYVQLLERTVGLSGQVLDIGCNRGWAAGLFKYYTGVDTNPHAIDEALQYWGMRDDAGHRRFIHVAESAPALPFAADSFDLVFAKDVLEHVADPVAFLHDATRVLRPGGGMFLCTPDAQRWVWNDPTHRRPYPVVALRALAGLAGLSVLATGHESVAPGSQVLSRLIGRGRSPLVLRLLSRLPIWPRNAWIVLRKPQLSGPPAQRPGSAAVIQDR